MQIDPTLLELLELIKASGVNNDLTKSDKLALELGCSLDELDKLLECALKLGLIERAAGTWRLTDKGRIEVQGHRERYIHERYGHKPGFLGWLTRLVEGSIHDWRNHWRHRHGLNEDSLKSFYKSIQDLQGRVEENSSLVELHPGERGVVAFALGGHGLMKRLAD
ncbi:MAG: hypothetical protein QXF26_09690, partial [Candidatus Bathyarchaeia archaeon]